MKLLVSLAAAGLLASPIAFAQSSSAPAPQAAGNAPVATTRTANAGEPSLTLQQHMKQDLQKAGFTDVSVMPDSFLVKAKDRAGNPVTMIFAPNSMTAIVAQTSPSGSSARANPASASDPAVSPASDPVASSGGDAGQNGMFTTVSTSDRLSSEVVGLDVYNNSNQDIGTIKDIAYSGGSLKAYVVAVGGFLGMGDHYVAVSPSDLKVTYDAATKKWRAKMDTTADQLKSAPAFTYPAKA